MTYNKVQGETKYRVVLVLATPSGSKLGNLTVEKFFVGISRVRHADHLRIMPCNRFELEYLKKLSFSPRMRYWYNNYVASVTSGSQNPRWRWDSGRKFILPSIEPQFKKILSKKAQNNTVNIKEYQALAKSLGVPFSNKKIVELEIDLEIWFGIYRNKRLYDDHRKNERKRRR